MGTSTKSLIEITSLVPEFPPTGGLVLRIQAKKSPDVAIKQLRLKILGDEFWQALSSIVGASIIATFKLTMHPITVGPEMMNTNDFGKGTTDVVTSIILGGTGRYKAKRKGILKRLNAIASATDPPFILEFEHGYKAFTWKSEGCLFSQKTRASYLLQAAEANESLLLYPKTKSARFDAMVRTDSQEMILTKEELSRSFRSISRLFPTVDDEIVNDPSYLTNKAARERISIRLNDTEGSALLQEIRRQQQESLQHFVWLVSTLLTMLKQEVREFDSRAKQRRSERELSDFEVRRPRKNSQSKAPPVGPTELQDYQNNSTANDLQTTEMLTQILTGGRKPEDSHNNNNNTSTKNAGTNNILHIPTPLTSRPGIVKEQAAIEIQRVFRGHKTRKYDSAIKSIVNNSNRSPNTKRAVIDDPLGIGNLSRSSSNLSELSSSSESGSNTNNNNITTSNTVPINTTIEEEEIEIRRRVTFGTQEDMQTAQVNESKFNANKDEESDEENGHGIKERLRSYSVSAKAKVSQIRRKSEMLTSKKTKEPKNKTSSDAEPGVENDNNTSTTFTRITITETTTTQTSAPKPKKERHSMFVKTQQLGVWIKKKVKVPGSKKDGEFDPRSSTQSNPT